MNFFRFTVLVLTMHEKELLLRYTKVNFPKITSA